MLVTAYKTSKVQLGDSLLPLLDTYLPQIHEKDIVVVTSKIVSICEGNVVKNDGTIDRMDLIRKEAQLYVGPGMSKYNASLSIKNNIMVSAAGIDESNGNGYYILWPKQSFQSAQQIWSHLKKKYNINHVGVVITDSVTVPLRWGTRGVAISWCGLEPLYNYIDKPDIFGRKLNYTMLSIIDGIATSAVLTMGEGEEQTPIAKLTDVPNVTYMDRPPSPAEIAKLRIDAADDIYAPLMDLTKWEKGEGA